MLLSRTTDRCQAIQTANFGAGDGIEPIACRLELLNIFPFQPALEHFGTQAKQLFRPRPFERDLERDRKARA